ncbi:MAG: lysozyme inhibitor LprI family protein [Prochlorothrix sp.]
MLYRKNRWLSASLGMLLLVTVVSCGSAPGDEAIEGEGSTIAAEVQSESDAAASDWVITPDGLGPVKVGMTLGDLKAELGPDYQFTAIDAFMVDFGAVEVSRGDEALFYLLYFVGEPLTDSDPITWIQVESDRFTTPEGIGPGSTIEEAEAVYGAATLNYNTDNEMREYVFFKDQPEGFSFRTDGEPGAFAGLYELEEGESYQETQNYRPDATIASLMIDGLERQSSSTPAQAANVSSARDGEETGEAYAAADEQLNVTYQKVKGELSAADQDRLTDVQLAWLDYRDRYCGAVTYDHEGSGQYEALLNGCLAQLTDSRTRRLEESLETGFFTDGRSSLDPGVVDANGTEIDCALADSTPEINYCASVASDMAQDSANASYEAALEAISPKAQTLLLESQEAWTAYQRSHCEFAVKDAVGGTGYGSFLASCEQALALEQAEALDQLASGD